MATINPDASNTMFNLAVDLVNQSSRNIFLTGKAGTGKTTFLKYIRNNCAKQMAVVAPTGVAAINAGGVTIHSFFQLPFSPFIPESKGFGQQDEVTDSHSLLSRLRLTGEKKKVIQELELLIIDEISMVRCDTLDAIDTVLRHIRHRRSEKFGGVQLLFIGDMFQLPPVVPNREWEILSEYYNSPYFFDSRVIRAEPPVYIEFEKIYRQSEEKFISLLNQVRNNEMEGSGMELLENCFQPGFRRSKEDGYIMLTTHNRKADTINEGELAKINARLYSFDAFIENDFSEKSYPAEERLFLKCGSQVMFIKNDAEKTRRYFNGKIGIVNRIEGDKIFVRCKDDPEEIEVKKETWQNIRYTVNTTTRKLDEEVVGSFTQYPLRLAWAITIHKSQGLTFEKAIIDAGEAFAPGQTYVALSRCTSLSGMVLQTRIREASLRSDPLIVAFSKTRPGASQLAEELYKAKRNYELSVLISIFDFVPARESGTVLIGYVKEHEGSFNPETQSWLTELDEKIMALQEVGAKFETHLKNLYQKELSGEINLQDRIRAAVGFFRERLNEILDWLQGSPSSTDSRLHAKEYNDQLKEIFILLSVKRHLITGLTNGFSIDQYHQLKKAFVAPPFSANAYAMASKESSDLPHPSLYMQLKILRDSICSKSGLPVYLVAGSNTIVEMSRYLPQTVAELKKISGFGEAKVEKYGRGFLDIITRYCQVKGLDSLVHEKTPKRERKPRTASTKSKVDTKAESYKLFKEGRSVNEIAAERNLAIQTIEGHLAHFVQRGDINIEELVSREKLVIIEPVLSEFNGGSLTSIKEKLGNTVGFSEIKLAIAWKEFQKSHGTA